MDNKNLIKDLSEMKDNLFQNIRDHQENIRLLLDVATGLKKLDIKNSYKNTVENEIRCLRTIKNLHITMRSLQEEVMKIKKLIGGNADDSNEYS